MIHRVVFGSIERFIGIITEHFAGAFPAWLAPVQVKVLPVTDRALDYAKELSDALDGQGFRVEVDDRNEKIGKKIREATLEKVPYMIVVGDRDMENKTVSVRTRAGEDLGAMSLEEFSTQAEGSCGLQGDSVKSLFVQTAQNTPAGCTGGACFCKTDTCFARYGLQKQRFRHNFARSPFKHCKKITKKWSNTLAK